MAAGPSDQRRYQKGPYKLSSMFVSRSSSGRNPESTLFPFVFSIGKGVFQLESDWIEPKPWLDNIEPGMKSAVQRLSI